MSESMKKVIRIIVLLIIFALSVILVIIGQKHIGASGLGLQLLGIIGLVFLLWNYNRQFK